MGTNTAGECEICNQSKNNNNNRRYAESKSNDNVLSTMTTIIITTTPTTIAASICLLFHTYNDVIPLDTILYYHIVRMYIYITYIYMFMYKNAYLLKMSRCLPTTHNERSTLKLLKRRLFHLQVRSVAATTLNAGV